MSEVVLTIEQYAKKHNIEELVKDCVRSVFRDLPESPELALHEEFARRASEAEGACVSVAARQSDAWLTVCCKSHEDAKFVRERNLHNILCDLAAAVVSEKPEDVLACLQQKLSALQQEPAVEP